MSRQTPSLHQAIKAGDTYAVSALIARGADVNETNDAGQTPLILAIVAGQYRCLRPLLRAGANPWLRDKTGLTAIEWAERKGETELARSLSHAESHSNDSSSEVSRVAAGQKKTPQPPVEDTPRKPLSPDEKARRFVTGLKQRLDEKVSRELTTPTTPAEKKPQDHQKQPEAQRTIPESVVKPEAQRTVPESVVKPEAQRTIPESVVKPEAPRTVPESVVKPEVQRTAPESVVKPEAQRRVPESVVRPEVQRTVPESVVKPELPLEAGPVTPERVTQPDLPKPDDIQRTAEQERLRRQLRRRETYRKLVDASPEIVAPEIVTRVDVDAETQATPVLTSASPLQKPTRTSSKRKRCPQCGTYYNSELLAYCSYDAVALVDEDAPIVSPRPSNSSPLLWILIVIVALLGALAGLFVTERLLRRPVSETQTASVPQPLATQKGIAVVGGQIEGKELTVPAAEVPANTVKEPTNVTVRIRVDRVGQVYSATSTADEGVLRQAAIEAAKKATFSVEKLRGRGAAGTITYTFK